MIRQKKVYQIYILHAERPLPGKNLSQHYIGYTGELEKRMKRHEAGTSGANIIAHGFNRDGIRLTLARLITVPDKASAEQIELYWKEKYKSARTLCPLCNPGATIRANGLKKFSPYVEEVVPNISFVGTFKETQDEYAY